MERARRPRRPIGGSSVHAQSAGPHLGHRLLRRRSPASATCSSACGPSASTGSGLFGDLPAFESVGLWGWLAIVAGIAWILVAIGLWALQPWARIFAMVVAGFSLFEAVLAFFQFPGSGLGFSMALHADRDPVVPQQPRGQGGLRRDRGRLS